MDDKAAVVHDNPLFSYNVHAQANCWDVHAETTESNKNSPKIPEKNASSMEGPMNSNSNSPQSFGKARDNSSGGGRHCRRQSIMEDDKEWEGLADLRMKVRRLMEEQEEESHEIYGTEEGNIMSYTTSPLIIQAGGVASYHPTYSPYAPRPRFLRYGGSPPEVSIHKRRPGLSIVDIQRSEEQPKAKAEAEAEAGAMAETDKGYNGEKSEAIETYENESQGPQLAQDPPSLEDQRSEITTEDAEQPQVSAEPDDTTEPNPNSLLAHSINTNTVEFKSSRPVIRKMMLPLFMFLVLVTATSGFVLLDNNYGGARIVQYHSAHMNPLSLRERVSLSKKMEEFSLLWKSALNSEYMGQLKNSSSAFVGKFLDSIYLCSCSSFSYLTSDKRWMTEENCTKFINFSSRLMGNLMSFYQDMVVSTRSAAGEIQRFCKCFKSNQTAEPMNISYSMESGMSKTATVDTDQASKDETNQRIQGNSSTVHVDPIQEPANSTIDVKNHDHPEPHDQIVAEDEENSTFCEENVLQGSHSSSLELTKTQRVHLNHKSAVLPVIQEAFNTTSQDLNIKFSLDHKSPGIKWKRVIVVATVMAILLILVAGGNFFLGWLMAEEMEVTKQYTRNKPRQRRQQIEQGVTPPALGSFIQYKDVAYSSESTPTAVRRSVRIRNRSLSPLPAPPTFTTPNSEHSFS